MFAFGTTPPKYMSVTVRAYSHLQEEASLLFTNLSSSLLLMNVNKTEENTKEMHFAASTIMEGASNILDYSSNVSCLTVKTKAMLMSFKYYMCRSVTVTLQEHIQHGCSLAYPRNIYSSKTVFHQPHWSSHLCPIPCHKVNALCCHLQKNISDALLNALMNTQSALLRLKDVNEGPTIIQLAHISVFVKR